VIVTELVGGVVFGSGRRILKLIRLRGKVEGSLEQELEGVFGAKGRTSVG
jgi:hypothetical protein